MTSQKTKILKYLKSGRRLTVLKALKLFGVYALSQRCGELCRDGYNVKSEMITLPNGKHVASYFIPQSYTETKEFKRRVREYWKYEDSLKK